MRNNIRKRSERDPLRIRIKRWCFLVLVLLWMAAIFWFSANNGADSSAQSGFLTELLGLPEWVVRKGAHMTEFGILAVLSYGFYSTFALKGSCVFGLSWLTAVLYAATDEFHQLFVEDRTGSVRDVFIDGAGALIGLVLVLGILKIFRRRHSGIKNPGRSMDKDGSSGAD